MVSAGLPTQEAWENRNNNFDLGRWQRGDMSSLSETCFAEYWADLPSIVPAEDNSAQVGIVDPYSFAHRMALGKYLMAHTGGETLWGNHYTNHWFWGYLAQLDWQWRSGRLLSPNDAIHQTGKKQTDAISRKSWWGFMNLNFSVAVYFGAAEAGLVPSVSLTTNELENDVAFQQCIKLWARFWKKDHARFVAQMKNTNGAFDMAIKHLYSQLWPVHTDVILVSVPLAFELEQMMSKEDRLFGLGWCHMVELLAAMGWTLLSLDRLMLFGAGFLPSKRLDGPETLKWLEANRREEYTTAITMHSLQKATPRKLDLMCGFLRRLAWWEFERQKLPVTLNALTHGSVPVKSLTLSRVLALVAAPHSVSELALCIGLLGTVVFYWAHSARL